MQKCRLMLIVWGLVMSLSLYSQTYRLKLQSGSVNPSILCTTMSIGGYEIEDVIIDSGSTATQLTLADYTELRERGILTSSNFVGEVNTRNSNGTYCKKLKYRIPSIIIGGLRVTNLEVTFDTNDGQSTPRLVGLNFFRLFQTVTIDFNENTLVLAK